MILFLSLLILSLLSLSSDSKLNSFHNRTRGNQGVRTWVRHPRRSYMFLSIKGKDCGSSHLILHQIEEGTRSIKAGYTKETGKVAKNTREVYYIMYEKEQFKILTE